MHSCAGEKNETSGREIYFIFSNACPYCAAEKHFLQDLERKYDVKVIYLEGGENRSEIRELFRKLNFSSGSVPVTIVGDYIFIGFSNQDYDLVYLEKTRSFAGVKNQIEKAVKELFELKGGKISMGKAVILSRESWLVKNFSKENDDNVIAHPYLENDSYIVTWYTYESFKSKKLPDVVVEVALNGSILRAYKPTSGNFKKPIVRSSLGDLLVMILLLVFLCSYLLRDKIPYLKELKSKDWVIAFLCFLILSVIILIAQCPEYGLKNIEIFLRRFLVFFNFF